MQGNTHSVQRRFRLMAEFEKAEKGKNDMSLSYGLEDSSDRSFTDWNAMITGPYNTKFERFYSIKIVCGNSYPNKPPRVQFTTKVPFLFV